jgi:hypothetical protein
LVISFVQNSWTSQPMEIIKGKGIHLLSNLGL